MLKVKYKLKLDDCCCDVKLLSDDAISYTKVHLPILASPLFGGLIFLVTVVMTSLWRFLQELMTGCLGWW